MFRHALGCFCLLLFNKKETPHIFHIRGPEKGRISIKNFLNTFIIALFLAIIHRNIIFIKIFPNGFLWALWHIRFAVPCLAEAWDAEACNGRHGQAEGGSRGAEKSRPTATLRRAWKKGEDKY